MGTPAHGISFGEAVRVWLRIALLSFGGPAGQIAVMHRILVEEKRWIGEERFLHALNFCMLLPGPEAHQLATYIGWLLHRTRGGLVAGLLFILPGLIAIMALSWIYVLYGRLGSVAGLLFGLKAAVLALVFQAVVRLSRRALGNGPRYALAAAAFLALFLFNTPFPLIVLSAAAIGWAASSLSSPAFAGAGHEQAQSAALSDADSALGEELPDHAIPNMRRLIGTSACLLALWLAPVAILALRLGPNSSFAAIAIFFSKLAVVTFGGAYAVLAYVAQAAVDHYHWLSPTEMLDGLGLAETTPGPLIMVTQFVGFLGAYRDPAAMPPLLAGTLGGLLTTWVTFVPCFLWIFVGAPYVERLRRNRALAAALAAVTAAVVGVILNLALWFTLHFLFVRTVEAGPFRLRLPDPTSVDPAALALSAAALIAVFLFRLGIGWVLAGCALAGLLLRLFVLA
jgi:chromate transporter